MAAMSTVGDSLPRTARVIAVHVVQQLFNSMDPSPFHDRCRRRPRSLIAPLSASSVVAPLPRANACGISSVASNQPRDRVDFSIGITDVSDRYSSFAYGLTRPHLVLCALSPTEDIDHELTPCSHTALRRIWKEPCGKASRGCSASGTRGPGREGRHGTIGVQRSTSGDGGRIGDPFRRICGVDRIRLSR